MHDRSNKNGLSTQFSSASFLLFCYAILIGITCFLLVFILIDECHKYHTPYDYISSIIPAVNLNFAQDALTVNHATIPDPDTEHDFIDLQPTVDIWLHQTPISDISLYIYDLDHERVAASYHPDQILGVASIYKLFFAYASYQQIDSAGLNGNQIFITTTDYRAGDYTLYECLDLIIRESYNGCADPIHDSLIHQQRVESLITDLKLKNTLEHGLYSTAYDITMLLRHIWQHPNLSEDSWNRLADSMLNQPITKIDDDTIYNWRQGFPAGFSASAQVYNKVGWDWNGHLWTTYADTGFLVFPEQNRHYAFAIITSGITNPDAAPLTQLGQMIETVVTQQDTED